MLDEKPILSICIPTYNRAVYLEKTIQSIVSEDAFLNSNNIELVISNNCSEDSTDSICNAYLDKYPDKIKYINQTTAIPADEHIFKTISYAKGQYVKLNNDTCLFNKGTLSEILNLIDRHSKEKVFVLANASGRKSEEQVFKNMDGLLSAAGNQITWIGGLLINKATFENLEDPLRYSDKKLPQVDIICRLMQNDVRVVYNNECLFSPITPKNKGGYNIAEIFGKNYLTILKEFTGTKNGLFDKTYKEQKKLILKFINSYYFDFKHQFSFQKSGYFKYMLPFYNKDFYFYVKYLGVLIKLFFSGIFHAKKIKCIE